MGVELDGTGVCRVGVYGGGSVWGCPGVYWGCLRQCYFLGFWKSLLEESSICVRLLNTECLLHYSPINSRTGLELLGAASVSEHTEPGQHPRFLSNFNSLLITPAIVLHQMQKLLPDLLRSVFCFCFKHASKKN